MKLEKIRGLMKENGIDYYVIPTDDFHASEYVGAYFETRSWLSGFTGSAGTLIIGQDFAGLWTDGRYFLQASQQLDGTGIELMKMGEPGVPSLTEYLTEHLAENMTLGFDGRCLSASFMEGLNAELGNKKIQVVYEKDLVGEIWEDRPALSKKPAWFLDDENCGQIVLVVNELEIYKMQQLLGEAKLIDERIEIVKGGTERQYSVYNGLQAINQEIVLVHDGARPFVTSEMIQKCYELAASGYPSIVAVPVKDTMKRVINGVVIETPNRDEMYSVQTPQAAPTSLLRQAHEAAKKENFLGTDEASLIEKYTVQSVHVVRLVNGRTIISS